ncbi:MAG: zinc finger domain-containing protein [Candidatus Thermoplasmatota archaeon]
MKKPETCVSCGKGLLEKGSTTFICPMCDNIIGRCSSCREQSVEYTCPKCGFIGP